MSCIFKVMNILIFRDFSLIFFLFQEFVTLILMKNIFKIGFLLHANMVNDVACALACHRVASYAHATWDTCVCMCVGVISD